MRATRKEPQARPRKKFKPDQPGNVARNRAKAANARRKQRLRELGEEE